MASHQDIAYLVPKRYWERIQSELNANKSDQSGGGVSGLNADGNVNANDLLSTMAVNLSLTQNPKAPFVKHADMMLKIALDNPKLTAAEKVRFMEAYGRAYDNQRQSALALASTPVPATHATPATPDKSPRPTPKPRQLPVTPQRPVVQPLSPPPSYRPRTSITPKTARTSAQQLVKLREQILNIHSSPNLSEATKTSYINKLADSAGLTPRTVKQLRSRKIKTKAR